VQWIDLRLHESRWESAVSTHSVPLERFPYLDTREPDEFQTAYGRMLGGITLELREVARGFHGRINYHGLQHVGLVYGAYGTHFRIGLPRLDVYAQGFPMKGSGSHTVGRAEVIVSKNEGVVITAGEGATLCYGADFAHLALLINPASLANKLSGLIGGPPSTPLRFERSVDYRRPEAEKLRRLVQFVARDLSAASEAPTPALVFAELEQVLMVSFLLGNTNNYSHLLLGQPRATSPWQVRRAEEYIMANWDQPITIEALAVTTNASARSLFYSFKRSRGYSPMAFVRQVRLQRARQMLADQNSATSVTDVAFACGFGNLGHFAKDYLRCFGEYPSDTLKRTKVAEAVQQPTNRLVLRRPSF
jgi:AraC-like DNA-binding protein